MEGTLRKILVKSIVQKPNDQLVPANIFGMIFKQVLKVPSVYVIVTDCPMNDGDIIRFEYKGIEYTLIDIAVHESALLKEGVRVVECRKWHTRSTVYLDSTPDPLDQELKYNRMVPGTIAVSVHVDRFLSVPYTIRVSARPTPEFMNEPDRILSMEQKAEAIAGCIRDEVFKHLTKKPEPNIDPKHDKIKEAVKTSALHERMKSHHRRYLEEFKNLNQLDKDRWGIWHETTTDPRSGYHESEPLTLEEFAAAIAMSNEFAARWIPGPKDDELVKLADLEPGSLFEYNGTRALKSEYRTDNDAIEAFIIGSGEMFWGGTHNAKDQRNLMVRKINSHN